MKIGIVTAHFLRNYGSVLQAYALKTVLQNMGHDVSIINYIPFVDNTYTKRDIRTDVKRIIKSGVFFALKRRKRSKLFMQFRENYLNMTTPYIGYKSLLNANMDFDAYICGSDQIWNPKLYGGFNEGYFLQFVKDEYKISYAPSVCVSSLNDDEQAKFKKALQGFHAVSVREQSSVEMLQPLSPVQVEWVLDPTLLLPREEWEKLHIRNSTKKYGIVYETLPNQELEKVIGDVKKYTKLPFYNISNNFDTIAHTSNQLAHVGPLGFLQAIKNASFVITNSFHCIVFCLHFHIPFIAFSHDNDERFRSLLTPCGLENRILEKQTDFDSDMVTLDDWNFDKISNFFCQSRQTSLKYLQDNLGDMHE